MSITRVLVGIVLAAGLATGLRASRPVEFRFAVAENDVTNPFGRQISAEVIMPSGAKVVLPAYVCSPGAYAVRARPLQAGAYTLGKVTEISLEGKTLELAPALLSDAHPIVAVSDVERLPGIKVNPQDPHQFVRNDGIPFLPIGANVAWPESGTPGDYYEAVMPKFAAAHLTWMRVWMAHWSGLDLSWLPGGWAPSPKPPELDLDVAAQWDRIVNAADDNGVYLQVVLQHHGQYTTYNDANWANNPWNAANPSGWLKSPADFFTDSRARLATLLKYRYIVARWGWSPSIFAWELFNEVHWTNAMREGHEADVAKWHDRMAEALRGSDAYGHLITSSEGNLRSPIYAKMDFYQPHLYPKDLLAAARTFDPDAQTLNRPVFYGEEGDDLTTLPLAESNAGTTMVPVAWAALMGQSQLPAQPWEGARLLDHHLEGQLGALHIFWVQSHLSSHTDLTTFSPAVSSGGSGDSALAAFGLRDPAYVVAWVYNRAQVFSGTGTGATGQLQVPNAAAGSWSATWYDTATGKQISSGTIDSAGDSLTVPTPPVTGSAVVVLQSLNRR
ncbi:MAG TPA: cellulase family glycosylhydrolase [Opitutaceae bacterium]|jgi:hypothetical protein